MWGRTRASTARRAWMGLHGRYTNNGDLHPAEVWQTETNYWRAPFLGQLQQQTGVAANDPRLLALDGWMDGKMMLRQYLFHAQQRPRQDHALLPRHGPVQFRHDPAGPADGAGSEQRRPHRPGAPDRPARPEGDDLDQRRHEYGTDPGSPPAPGGQGRGRVQAALGLRGRRHGGAPEPLGPRPARDSAVPALGRPVRDSRTTS